MTMRNVLRTIILAALISCASDKKSPPDKIIGQQEDSINRIDIYLYPAFNNSSIISIDKLSKTMQYKVDTVIRWNQSPPLAFSMNLDSFEIHTQVDSFYSQTFLDSIKFKPENAGVTDGLSIYTFIKRDQKLDTIYSGNVYPQILSTNIISQLDYIAQKSTDRSLRNYIKDLKRYFE